MTTEADRAEELSLDSAVRHILEECRMVLPGIQALFGFQLIAVFNEGFAQKLSVLEQPQVDSIEHKPVAPKYVSPRDQYLLGNLSDWSRHNPAFLVERFFHCRTFLAVLISLDGLAPHGEKKRLIARTWI